MHRNRETAPSSYLYLSAYLTFGAVVVIGLINLQQPEQRLIAIPLLAGFGALLLWQPGAAGWKPHLRLAIQTWLIAGLLNLDPGWSVFQILFFVLGPEVMLLFPKPRTGLAWILIFSIVTGTILFVNNGLRGLLIMLPYIAGYLFFGMFGYTLRQVEESHQQSQELLEKLQAAHRQLQEFAAEVEELAITRERNRLAREMHDALGHQLTVSAVQLEGAQRLIFSDPGRAVQMVDTAREQVRAALSELRRAVAALRAPLDEDRPIEQALQRLGEAFKEATGIDIDLQLPQAARSLPPAYRQAMYRTAQEALTNIQRHSGASQAWLALEVSPGQANLTISDNGRGIPVDRQQAGFGLRGVRERAAQLGGELRLSERPGGGACLRLELPLSGNLPEAVEASHA